MFKYKLSLSIFLLLLLVQLDSSAKEMLGYVGKNEAAKTASSDCQEATAQTELNINNVRTRLLAGGDLWWDLDDAKYEVPKVEPGSGVQSKNSLFAGALWIGGIDALGQLKVAAQTYRQSGNDFYPGPLDDAGQVCRQVCSDFDRFWKVEGSEINQFLAAFEGNGGTISENEVPASILNWPARNNQYFTDFELPEDKDLAPFWDVLGDGDYNPLEGDYPVIDSDEEGVFADQMIWWIFNDKGNAHTETNGEAIGLQIGALAFGFATNDEVNNMTFYKYVIENNSTSALDSVYFAQWVDPDLGEFQDDYVGCDVENSMGIVYNGDAFDDGAGGYGDAIPMLGVDFFQGPKDEQGEELGMTSFLFYNNDFTVIGNPETVTHFYGYISGTWKDGSPFTLGGNGYGGTEPSPYMFPDDPSNPNGWSECAIGIQPADRRFLQSSGAFKLLPGVINDVIVGVVWVPDAGGCGQASFTSLLNADRKAQALFDSNFKLIDGPDAPSITIREVDQQLILSLWNDERSNNFNEEYAESDAILSSIGKPDSQYVFQGYRIYQLADASISPSDYGNPDFAREIYTVDITDGIARLINYEEDPILGLIPVVAVDATDNGIIHTFTVTEDQFAPGDKQLVNHKRYYFSAVAYAYNAYTPYDPNNPSADPNAQQIPYLEGRNNVQVYTAIPHSSASQNGGTVLNASYGDGPDVTQISGIGNGCAGLELTEASIDEIVNNGSTDAPVYEGGSTPIGVKIHDPFNVPPHKFRLRMIENPFFSLPNEEEVEDDCVFKTIYTTTQGGTMEVMEDGSLEYTAPDGFQGYDRFCYEIINQYLLSDQGCVVLNVNASPIDFAGAMNDTRVIYSANWWLQTVELPIAIDVLANDIQTNATVTEISSPSNGTVSMDDNIITYTPTFGFFGKDAFTYTIQDDVSITRETARVSITIIDPRESALIDAVDDVIIVSDGTATIDIIGNDINPSIGSDRVSTSSRWELEDLTTGRIYTSSTSIAQPNELAIGGWEYNSEILNDGDLCEEARYNKADPLGFTVTVGQAIDPSQGNGVISAEWEFENIQSRWITTITDGEASSPYNWIRSGENSAETSFSDFRTGSNGEFYDRDEYYEDMLGGGIAPYCLTNTTKVTGTLGEEQVLPLSPACSDCYGNLLNAPPNNTLSDLFSVDIVMTPNKDLWTKCVVIEMGRVAGNNVGKGKKNGLRQSNSLDKNGEAIDGEVGRSWFPGYAINVETGKRLNMMFSENSFIANQRGADMLWNPTSVEFVNVGNTGNDGSNNDFRMGGEQFIYVMNSDYDEGQSYKLLLDTEDPDNKESVYDECMYVAATRLEEGFDLLSIEDGLIPSEVKIKVRVKRPYEQTEADRMPEYEFDMSNFAAVTGVTDTAKSALDAIQVVPNPYYAFSAYENNKLDNRIKITNLPSRAIVSIFTLDGTLIRKLEVDNTNIDTSISSSNNKSSDIGTTENAIDWDLKNFKNIPIASGMYIIHVEAPELGEERTLKWFGVVRPVDLDTF